MVDKDFSGVPAKSTQIGTPRIVGPQWQHLLRYFCFGCALRFDMVDVPRSNRLSCWLMSFRCHPISTINVSFLAFFTRDLCLLNLLF
jgi:hypothetical protein